MYIQLFYMNLKIMGPNDPNRPRLVLKLIDANMELERHIVESAATRTNVKTEHQSMMDTRDMRRDPNNEQHESMVEKEDGKCGKWGVLDRIGSTGITTRIR